jgi:hypothetical protein
MTGGKWRFFGHGRRKWTSGGEPRGGMGAGKRWAPNTARGPFVRRITWVSETTGSASGGLMSASPVPRYREDVETSCASTLRRMAETSPIVLQSYTRRS